MCETQLDARLAGVIVAAEKRVGKRGAGPRGMPANPIGCAAQPRALGLELIGPRGKAREKPLEPAVPLRHFVALVSGPSPG